MNWVVIREFERLFKWIVRGVRWESECCRLIVRWIWKLGRDCLIVNKRNGRLVVGFLLRKWLIVLIIWECFGGKLLSYRNFVCVRG